MTKFNPAIDSAESLVTEHEQTRQGFLEFALHKNAMEDPYITQSKALLERLKQINTPDEILKIEDFRPALLSAAGLSEKALKHFNESDKIDALVQLLEKNVKPAGDAFREEIVYRFLLTKGDALGGKMRNVVGNIAQQRLITRILAVLDNMGMDYHWFSNSHKTWFNDNDAQLSDVKAISWQHQNTDYVLAFNVNIAKVNKNVDINLFSGSESEYVDGTLAASDNRAIMFGELKGGIDPAGADEHWKTGNSALQRDRDAFNNSIKTSFVGAAIVKNMAEEIYSQLLDDTLTNAANLYKEDQLVNYATWLVKGC